MTKTARRCSQHVEGRASFLYAHAIKRRRYNRTLSWSARELTTARRGTVALASRASYTTCFCDKKECVVTLTSDTTYIRNLETA